jgi:hypothetical protein
VRRFFRFLAFAAAAVLAAGLLYVGFTLPRRAAMVPAPPATVVAGAYHIHTSRSDGSGTVEDVAEAAADAGLKFVVLTDHGDATRPPDPPAYRHGVLCIDAVEISTAGGHLVALNLSGPSPYPLGGDPRDVIDDVHRLGGWAIAAHPDSPREELRWRAGTAGLDGVEWLNADSEWRDESPWRLAGALARAMVRPAGAIAALFTRPQRSLGRWDAAARAHGVFGLAAVDAHARIGATDTADAKPSGLRFPSYGTMFNTLAQAVVLDRALTGDAPSDARRVLDAVKSGRTYAVVRAFAGVPLLEFSAMEGSRSVVMGGELDGTVTSATLSAIVHGVPDARIDLLRDGQRTASATARLTQATPQAGVYRVEVFYPGFDFPWLVSNPIRLGLAPPISPAPPVSPPLRTLSIPADARWTLEQDRASAGMVRVDDGSLRFEFRLGPGPLANQYAALVTSAAGEAAVERIRFQGRADRPMRLAVQVRMPGGSDGRRWQRSVYLDATPRSFDLALGDFDPVGPATSLRPIVAKLQGILFVVDTVNTRPGASGTVWLTGVTLALGNPSQEPEGPRRD